MWGLQSIDDLDPVVKLLMQGFAARLYDIHNEVEDIQVRILESLATTLTPSIMISPRPAHAIAQAYPSDSEAIIDRRTVFQDKKIPFELQKKGIKSFSFVPVNTVRLVSGKIRYMISERIFCRIEDNGEKTSVANAQLSEKTNYTAWIGMDLHPDVETFQGISFFIDFPLSAGKYDKIRILPYSHWSIDGQTLEMKTGLPDISDAGEYSAEDDDSFFNKYNRLTQIDENISDCYRLQYLTVNNDIPLKTLTKKSFPSEISDLFTERITSSTEACYWIKVVLPVHIDAKDIHDMKVYINTFPVANKTLYSQIYPLAKAASSILPLSTQQGEHFISVEHVSDSHGMEYRSIPYTTAEKPKSGFYSIKRGGVERFDRRNAAEYIERMIDLLRDEFAAFSSLDTDNMRNLINEQKEGLKQIEYKFQDSMMWEYSIPDYLVLDRVDREETIYVDYWATTCELTNNLRTGKILTPLTSALLAKDSCRLLTQTRGGKSEANVNGKLDAFRYVLTSRDQIITYEDITNFCRLELGEKITRVNVTRGIAVSPKPKEGLIRTIDVHLSPSQGYEKIVREMETDLLTMLHRKSPDSFNYRIMIE
jgi:hypothetical protein